MARQYLLCYPSGGKEEIDAEQAEFIVTDQWWSAQLGCRVLCRDITEPFTQTHFRPVPFQGSSRD